MSNPMQDLHSLGLNPFAVTLLAESMLKSAYVKHRGTKPLTFEFPVHRDDCEGWAGVRITIEAIPDAADGVPASPAPAATKPPMIEIQYELGGRWWHMNCHDKDGKWMPSGIMREVKRDNEEKRSLIRCLRCGEQGYYQFGWVGLARVPLEPTDVSGVTTLDGGQQR